MQKRNIFFHNQKKFQFWFQQDDFSATWEIQSDTPMLKLLDLSSLCCFLLLYNIVPCSNHHYDVENCGYLWGSTVSVRIKVKFFQLYCFCPRDVIAHNRWYTSPAVERTDSPNSGAICRLKGQKVWPIWSTKDSCFRDNNKGLSGRDFCGCEGSNNGQEI